MVKWTTDSLVLVKVESTWILTDFVVFLFCRGSTTLLILFILLLSGKFPQSGQPPPISDNCVTTRNNVASFAKSLAFQTTLVPQPTTSSTIGAHSQVLLDCSHSVLVPAVRTLMNQARLTPFRDQRLSDCMFLSDTTLQAGLLAVEMSALLAQLGQVALPITTCGLIVVVFLA